MFLTQEKPAQNDVQIFDSPDFESSLFMEFDSDETQFSLFEGIIKDYNALLLKVHNRCIFLMALLAEFDFGFCFEFFSYYQHEYYKIAAKNLMAFDLEKDKIEKLLNENFVINL